MDREYSTYAPQDISELLDFLAMMMLSSPTFEDKTGYLPERNLETVFVALHEGLLSVRAEIGDEKFRRLNALSSEMRRLFENDPRDINGGTASGCRIIREMEYLLKATRPQ